MHTEQGDESSRAAGLATPSGNRTRTGESERMRRAQAIGMRRIVGSVGPPRWLNAAESDRTRSRSREFDNSRMDHIRSGNRSRGGRTFRGEPRGQAHFRRPRFLAKPTYFGRKMSQTPGTGTVTRSDARMAVRECRVLLRKMCMLRFSARIGANAERQQHAKRGGGGRKK